jgi:hypothetical protein
MLSLMLQIAEDDVQPLFQQMLLEHAVNGTSFAFYLSNKPGDGQSELTLGGYNPDKFKGDLQWHPLSSEDYWSIVFQGLKACGSWRNRHRSGVRNSPIRMHAAGGRCSDY